MTDQPCQDISLARLPDRPGDIEVVLSFRRLDDVVTLRPRIPANAEVASVTGFERQGQQFAWDGRTEMPAVEFVMPVSEYGAAGRSQADTGDWALVQAPRIPFGLSRRGTSLFANPTAAVDRRVHVRDDGIASSDGAVVYLGSCDLYSRSVLGQEIRVAVPAAADMATDPEDVLDALEQTALDLDLRSKDETVLGVAAPTKPVNWGPAGQKRGNSGFWVRDTAGIDRPNSTWIHEYIHTRQAFEPTQETMWLVEATAVFFATYAAHQQGLISDGAFQQSLNTHRADDDVLANPQGGWSSAHTPYKKGARVAAWIDRAIRDETGGSNGLEAVVRGLNLQSDRVTHDDVLDLVASSMGRSRSDATFCEVERTIERIVRGPNVPDTVGPPGSDPLPPEEIDRFGSEIVIEDFIEELLDGDGKFDEGMVFDEDSLDPSLYETDELFLEQ